MKIDGYSRGFQDGLSRAATWLHEEADRMNGPFAKRLLNDAAFSLGIERKNLRKGRRSMAANNELTSENDNG